MRIENLSHTDFHKVLIQFNKNVLGLAPESKTINLSPPLKPNQDKIVEIALTFSAKLLGQDLSSQNLAVEVAVKNVSLNNIDKFTLEVSSKSLIIPAAKPDKKKFIRSWQSIDEELELELAQSMSIAEFESRLHTLNIRFVAKYETDEVFTQYFSATLVNLQKLLLEAVYEKSTKQKFYLMLKSPISKLTQIVGTILREAL